MVVGLPAAGGRTGPGGSAECSALPGKPWNAFPRVSPDCHRGQVFESLAVQCAIQQNVSDVATGVPTRMLVLHVGG